jgi:site-specific DNA-methyltransferase (adenine-specific)
MTQAFNMDCMEAMAQMPDKAFDLAIVDPPYGIGMDSRRLNGRSSKGKYKIKQSQYIDKEWDNFSPNIDYHNELKRVSKHQIVWGANYLDPCIFYGQKWIVWAKNGQSLAPDSSDCEIACTSFNGLTVKMFVYDWVGFGAINSKETRIHPTQKPIKLYEWLLKNYAKEGWRILDTHLGSGSSRIAADKMGFDFVGYELDTEYFEAQEKRFAQYKSQLTLGL